MDIVGYATLYPFNLTLRGSEMKITSETTPETFYNSVRVERSYLPEWDTLPNKQRKKWRELLDIIDLRVNRLAGETYENSKPKEKQQ